MACLIKLYTVEEVADCCRVSRTLVYRWIQAGKLESVQLGLGGLLRVTEEALYAFLGLASPQQPEAPRDQSIEEMVAYARQQVKLAKMEQQEKRRVACDKDKRRTHVKEKKCGASSVPTAGR